MKGKRPSQSAITRKEHADQSVAELLLRLRPNDREDVKKATEIAQTHFGLSREKLKEFIAKWSAYADVD